MSILGARVPGDVRHGQRCLSRETQALFTLIASSLYTAGVVIDSTQRAASVVRLPLITNSALKTFRRCAREYSFAYERSIRPAVDESDALRFGSLLHSGLEAWWLAPSADERLDRALAVMAPRARDEYDRARAETMMLGYTMRWGEDDEYDVLGVEVEFRAPLVNPATGAASKTWDLGGKLDGLLRKRSDGLVYVLEHKTSSEDIGLGSTYWERLQLDSQISMYYVGARSHGHGVAGCVYDVLGKPKLVPLKATPAESRKYKKDGSLYAAQRLDDESANDFRARLVDAIAAEPDRYFQRGTVVRLADEEADNAFDVWALARQVRESQLANRWPRNPDSCIRWSHPCSYWPVCTGTASLDDERLYVRVEQVHQELSAAANDNTLKDTTL